MEREETLKELVARQAGLEAAQMRTFEELTDTEKAEVEWNWGFYDAEKYLYAVKTENWETAPLIHLVARRWRIPAEVGDG